MIVTVRPSAVIHGPLAVLLFVILTSVAVTAAAAQTVYTLHADGLACPFCAYGIEKQLNRVEGTKSVSTDVKSGTVVITMKQGARLNEADARGAVDKAGFTMRDFKLNENGE